MFSQLILPMLLQNSLIQNQQEFYCAFIFLSVIVIIEKEFQALIRRIRTISFPKQSPAADITTPSFSADTYRHLTSERNNLIISLDLLQCSMLILISPLEEEEEFLCLKSLMRSNCLSTLSVYLQTYSFTITSKSQPAAYKISARHPMKFTFPEQT